MGKISPKYLSWITLHGAGLMVGLLLLAAVPASAEVRIDGFLQGLYGGRLDQHNPTETEYTASETRLQLRTEHFGDGVEFFGRLDFLYDGALANQYDWELREGYMKFRLGTNFDFKVGRQILTWGTGDLIFINDVFAKDYRSFFVGRDDQYLKAPQDAIRGEYYSPIGSLALVWSPRFEPNRLPDGRRLSFYSPLAPGPSQIVGTGIDSMFQFRAVEPPSEFKNSEIAGRFSRTVLSTFQMALYAYHGFYKNPMGLTMTPNGPMPYYPRLNVYGASLRGTALGGILWLEGGYLDSRDDPNGDDPMVPNSSGTGLIGYERQIITNLTVNAQWQADVMVNHDAFARQMAASGAEYIRDKVRHLVTSRITKLMMNENLTLSSFVFYSPTDEDVYWRFSATYKYTDELAIAVGGNIFAGKHENTDFGQFQKNDNVYLKLTYGFE